MQDDALVRLYLPASHFEQFTAPPRLKVPASHKLHEAPLVWWRNSPFRQSSQVSCPVAPWYRPGAHATQVVDPVEFVCLPAWAERIIHQGNE